MLRNLLSVGGLTLLSRVTGFARDIVMGATLGAGWINDAFVIAFKLPNHFRAIFAEGSFNAAFSPHYARILESEGSFRARLFSSRIYTALIVCLGLFTVLALLFTPELVGALAPGFKQDPQKFDLATSLTRITFPYLFFMTLTVLQAGVLNASGRFAIAAFAPVLLNLAMIVALACAFLFPNAGYAAATGVAISGVLQWALVDIAARREGLGSQIVRPRAEEDEKKFLKTLGPAIIGSTGPQIAVFADTIIGSMLPTGGPSAIYYADRIYQLPIGVIGIAAGVVLLPEMSRLLAAGEPDKALRAQNRAMALTIALSLPFAIAFLTIPDLIMRAAFTRGQFTLDDAAAAARVLTAYAGGLMAIVLISSARASFQARGDMTTPMIAALTSVAVNVALKIALFPFLGAAGLALATSAGAWVNFLILFILAIRADFMAPNSMLGKVLIASAMAGAALTAVALLIPGPVWSLSRNLPIFARETQLIVVGLIGAASYALVFFWAARVLKLNLGTLKARDRVRD